MVEGSVLLAKIVTIDHADILTLPTTPAPLLAAPGAGKIIIPVYASAVRSSGFVDYTNVAAFPTSVVSVVWDRGNGQQKALGPNYDANDLFAGGFNAIAYFPGLAKGPVHNAFIEGDTYDGDNGVNQPLALSVANDSNGDFTGGDAGNQLFVTVFYTVITIP